MAYGDFQDLARRTADDKVLRDKAFNIAKNPIMMDIKEGLLLWFINVLIRRLQVVVLNLYHKISVLSDLVMQQLAEELHKPINWKFKKRKVYSPFTDNIWDDDLVDLQSISKFNK